jgi:cyclic beta-1,2-glucan synthetase
MPATPDTTSAADSARAEPGGLKARMKTLAGQHTKTRRDTPSTELLDRVEDYYKAVQKAYRTFSSATDDGAQASSAAEWLLDNFYIVQQAVRQIREDLPSKYYRELPKLVDGELSGYPRVYVIAREIVQERQGRVDPGRLRDGIGAYQQVTPLTMGELWAVPTMLRIAAVEVLAQGLDQELAIDAWPPEAPARPLEGVAPDVMVANSILALRALAVEDWKAFFEAVSLVETTLSRDPARVYDQMDFDTRDRYRRVVEQLALGIGEPEVRVAGAAVKLAGAGSNGDRESHVGYFLIDDGRYALEAELGYQPSIHMRWRRWLLDRHPTLAYLGSIGFLSALVSLGLVAYARSAGAGAGEMAVVFVLSAIPAITLAVSLTNRVLTSTLPPRVLPKMDYEKGVPGGARAMVVIPALLSDQAEVESLLRQLELHYLRNSDPHIYFGLLSDFADAPDEQMPEDQGILDRAIAGVGDLNRQYGREGVGPFFLLHRKRLWNASEAVWMGWERKRGKLEEFNRLVLGEDDTSFTKKVGDLGVLPKIRYVITLDADTILPKGEAHRLVGTLAHPLNQAQFDPDTGRVEAGYTVLQPRTEIQPTSSNRSIFSRLFAGDTGLDLYTRAVSDVYQDLFGEGIFVGKGIYEVASFHQSLVGKVPENTLLSHDLFEGIQGRAGLVSDIVLYEDYPASYPTYVRRWHRWIRGDWQLLPWLLRLRGRAAHSLRLIDRWKMADNMRRTLRGPALVALLVIGWLWLPGAAWVWTLVSVLIPAAVLLSDLVSRVAQEIRSRSSDTMWRTARQRLLRWLLAIAFLPYEAMVALDGILKTLYRLMISRRNLLRWTTAARVERLLGTGGRGALLNWIQMAQGPGVAVVAAALIAWLNPVSLPTAIPLLLTWFLSPQIAYWISQPIDREPVPLRPQQREELRRIARRTWFFFEQFVGPDDHWLPPDHFQEDPLGTVAHRTSPTNIGLGLISTMAACDLGYIGLMDLALRLRDAFRGLDQLERHRGHFLNWYDTRSMQPLPPRYVSTVDSGNLAGSLMALRQGCLEMLRAPLLRWARWQGLLDVLAILEEVVGSLEETSSDSVRSLRAYLDDLQHQVRAVEADVFSWGPLLAKFLRRDQPELERRLMALVEDEAAFLQSEALQRLRLWMGRVEAHLLGMQREQSMLVPWLLPFSEPPSLLREAGPESAAGQAWKNLLEQIPAQPRLDQAAEITRELKVGLSRLAGQISALPGSEAAVDEARNWCLGLLDELDAAPVTATQAGISLSFRDLAARSEVYIQEMDFSFLMNEHRQVFHIGYHVDNDRLDSNFYDLLASEARIASLVAIAKHDVLQRHWLHLGRPLIRVDGMRGLLSWNGTMFEYLMPTLLLRNYRNTLLNEGILAAVQAQIEYGAENNVPWGISESGYYGFDNRRHYQYRGFGAPKLGFKRGLTEDLVVAPYASLMAIGVRPQAVLKNVQRLLDLEMLGTYGFYESVDFTPARLPLGEDHAIVKSFMAHHQAMLFLALVNMLEEDCMVRRFHSDPRVQSVDLLLQERIPYQVPTEQLPEQQAEAVRVRAQEIQVGSWSVPVDTASPRVHVLSNGRYTTMVTNSGGGLSSWRDRDITRWRADTTKDDWGNWIYLQDLDSKDLWSIGKQPLAGMGFSREVTYWPHKAEFRCTGQEIALEMEITISPEDDVEIRRIRISNRGGHARRLSVTSYGEVVLASQETDRRHPAFNKLFIESDFLPEANGLVFRRRPRSGEEAPVYLYHGLVSKSKLKSGCVYETDRARFIGRGGSIRAPAALDPDGKGFSGTTGATLDPIMSLSQQMDIEPHSTVEFAFVTVAAGSREAALDVSGRYQDWTRLERAFERARTQSERELRQLELTTSDLKDMMELLSLLYYPHPALRADPGVLAANSRGQPGLWAYGISGDYPIIVGRVSQEEEVALARELVRAHIYWRARNLMVDLVLLNEKESGYAQGVQGKLRRLLVRMDSDDWLNRRGGIFILRSDGMDKADYNLLCTVARANLDPEKGTVGEQLGRIDELPGRLPNLAPTRSAKDDQEMAPIARPDDLLFDNGWGGFTPDGHEYVIFREPGVPTPAPWSNVIANPGFGSIITDAGCAFSWAENSGENRLTPWHNDPVADVPGEVLYLRDEETGSVWSPTPEPAGAEAPYVIRHGAGYTVFEHHSHGLKQRMRIFAARDDPVKVTQLRLENTLDHTRRITATYYAEWVLGVHRDGMQQFILPEYDAASQALLARNPYNVEFGGRVAFVAANKELHDLTADRSEFLGRLGTLASPAALMRIGLANAVEAGHDQCAAIQLHIDLEPGGSEEVYFLLGQGRDGEHARELVQRYQDSSRVDAAWGEIGAFWNELLGTISVQTPSKGLDILINRWLLYQALACRIWGRSAFYQSSGAYGFRDQLQDVMTLLQAAPEMTREHILRAARHQFEAGDVLHWWHPPSGRGVRTRITDDLLWLPYVVAEYIAATDDASILDEEVAFLKGEPLTPEEEERYGQFDTTAEVYSIYEHCLRAIDRGLTSGPHDLPLIGTGDWNDGMNHVGADGAGESIWLGWFLCDVMAKFATLCDARGDHEKAGSYRQGAEALRDALEAHGWDGEWYLRAYYDDGTPLGSMENRECKIDSLAQSWAVLSAAAKDDRAQQAMRAVLEHLVRDDDRLVLLFTPPFDRTRRDPGYIKGYPPGIRENGGQYTHAAIWAAWAFAELGEAETANRLLGMLNPIHHGDTRRKVERYRVEPYVMAGDVYSEAPHTGRGGWTWYTGSGGWMYRLGLEAILGVRRNGKTLEMKPCIPKEWDEYKVSYKQGPTQYEIHVRNPDHLHRGVVKVTLDGEIVQDGKVPLSGDGQEHRVEVVMGSGKEEALQA